MAKLHQYRKELLLIGFILLSLVPFHWRSFFYGPIAIHVWAAADWYALALGFIDNGMDFFHPQVNQLNLQFPAEVPPDVLQGITAVDFPINPYLVAGIMKLLGTTSPMVYRAYTLVLSLLGLFFLYKATYFQSKCFLVAAFVVCFVRFQPAYAYYMDGFMPTQNALSVFFIGMYFLVKYMKANSFGSVLGAIFFMTLAALMRLPFVIPLIGFGASVLWKFYSNKKIEWSVLFVFALGFTAILGYFIYNHYLANTFGSIFLSTLMPPRSLYEFVFYWMGGIALNQQSILPLGHVFMLALLGYGVYKNQTVKNAWNSEQWPVVFLILLGIGVFLYSLVMARQLVSHDYYFNDFLWPSLLIGLVWTLQYPIYNASTARKIIVALFILTAFQNAYSMQTKAYKSVSGVSKADQTVENFKGAYDFLVQQNIPKESRLLIIGTYAPSVPLNELRRKCYGVRVPNQEDMARALSWDYAYIITQNSFINDIQHAYPLWDSKVKTIATNGKITIHQLRTQ